MRHTLALLGYSLLLAYSQPGHRMEDKGNIPSSHLLGIRCDLLFNLLKLFDL